MSSGSAIELLRGFARAETKTPERNGSSGRQVTREFASLLEGSRARRTREPERQAPAAEPGGRTERRSAQTERRRDDITKSDDAALMYPENEEAVPRAAEAAPAEAASAAVAGEDGAAAPAGATAAAAEPAAKGDVAAGSAQTAITAETQSTVDGLLRLVQISRAAAEALRTAPTANAVPVESAARPVAEPAAVPAVPVGVAAEPTRVPARAVVEAVPTPVPVERPVTITRTNPVTPGPVSAEDPEERAVVRNEAAPVPRSNESVRTPGPIAQASTDEPVASTHTTGAASAAVPAAQPVETRRETVQRRGEAARIEARIISERAESGDVTETSASQVARALIGRVEGKMTDGVLQAGRRERIGALPGAGDALTSQSNGGLSLRSTPGGAVEAGGARAAAQPFDLRAELSAQERTAAVEQIVEAARAQVGARRSQVTLQLEPPELGRLRIEVQVRDSAIGIQVRAETRVAHELLQSRMGELRRALESQGMTLDRAQVELRSPEQTSSGQTHERGLEQQSAFEHDRGSGWSGEHGRAEERGEGQPDERVPVETAEAVQVAGVAQETVESVSAGINLLV